MRKTLRERFEAKVSPPIDSGCLLWTGFAKNSGHGMLNVGGTPQLAHRIAWELSRGPIPDGLCVCHRCDVPRCVNVEHLFLGTQLDNIADREAKGRTRQGHVPLRSGENHGCAKLTWAIVDEMRRRYALGGETMAGLGREFGVGRHQAQNIIKRKHWVRQT